MKNLNISVSALSVFAGVCLLLCIEFFSADPSMADTDAQIIQRQRENLELLRKGLGDRQTLPPDTPDYQPPEIKTPGDPGTCHQVGKISVAGVTIFDQEEIEQITQTFEGRCLNVNDINSLLRELTVKYFDAGYITSRPYLAPQDLSDGILEIELVEGEIEKITFDQRQQKDDVALSFIFPTATGKILNLRDLEQGLDQLNRLQSNNVTMSLVPGTNPGDSLVVLDNPSGKKSRYIFAIDNNGSESTGEIQGYAGFGYDNPFGVADYFSLMASYDLHHDSGKNSRNFNVRYEIPYGWNLFSLAYNHFDYNNSVAGISQDYSMSGKVRNVSLNANRLVYRNNQMRLAFDLKLDWRDEENYLLDVLLDTSSQQFVVARGVVRVEQFFPALTVVCSSGIHRGLDVLDAQNDSSTPAGLPQAEFSKMTADLSLQAEVRSIEPVVYSLTAHMQYSPDLLFPSEQINIGSLYTVRGFKKESLSGNKGGFIRQEMAWPISAGANLDSLDIGYLEPFIGFDWGRVKVVDQDIGTYEELQSWSLGVRGTHPQQSITAAYSQPIDKPDNFTASDGEFSFRYSRNF